MRRYTSIILSGIYVLLFCSAAIAAQVFTPGAPGIGDPYYPLAGNGGYDVDNYLLEVSYNPDTDFLIGKATIMAKATQNLSKFNLDFEKLTVRSITVDNQPATWNHNLGELTVIPPHGISNHKMFTTVVQYDGIPQLSASGGFLHTVNGATVQGEPFGAAFWYPVNDHPIDKASYEFRVTAPSDREVIANGVLTRVDKKGALSTWIWKAKEPMASYLTTVNIGHYDFKTYQQGNIKFYDGIAEDLAEPLLSNARATLSRQGEMIDFVSGYLGRYPFSSAGAVVDTFAVDALENQSRITIDRFFFESDFPYKGHIFANGLGDVVQVHEIAHMWLGDSTTIARWSEIWLNEGFARYFDAFLWFEHEGIQTADESFAFEYARPAADPFWQVIVADPQPENQFSSAVYNRGGMTLHALRKRVGDQVFFNILRTWAESNAGKHVTTTQFITLAEQISGMDLQEFFNVWLYTPEKPPVEFTH